MLLQGIMLQGADEADPEYPKALEIELTAELMVACQASRENLHSMCSLSKACWPAVCTYT